MSFKTGCLRSCLLVLGLLTLGCTVDSGRRTEASELSSTPAGVELTAGAHWQYRLVLDGRPEPWRDSVAAALEPLDAGGRFEHWPEKWVAFGPVMPVDFGDNSAGRSPRASLWRSLPAPENEPDAETLSHLPQRMEMAGRALERVVVRPAADGMIDLAAHFDGHEEGKTAFLFARVDAPAPTTLTVHAGGDWWMQWWLNGEEVFSTIRGGNGHHPILETSHAFELDLPAGPSVLTVRVVSGSGGWGMAGEARVSPAPAEQEMEPVLEARRRFDVADPQGFASLTLTADSGRLPDLNGRSVPLPLEGMVYRRVMGIPATMLRAGENVLSLRWTGDEVLGAAEAEQLDVFTQSANSRRLAPEGDLWALTSRDAALDMGPILGAAGENFFTLAARTNLPTSATVVFTTRDHNEAVEVEAETEPGLYHRFRVEGYSLDQVACYHLRLRPEPGIERRTPTIHLPRRTPGPLRFAVVGDPQGNRRAWAAIASAVAEKRP